MKRLFVPYRALTLIYMLGGCAASEPPISFLGMAAPPSTAIGTVFIGPDTRAVNVQGGDTVRFVAANGKEFTWDFEVASGVSAFDLNRVAPAGVLDHNVRAFVRPDPKYSGGDENGR